MFLSNQIDNPELKKVMLPISLLYLAGGVSNFVASSYASKAREADYRDKLLLEKLSIEKELEQSR